MIRKFLIVTLSMMFINLPVFSAVIYNSGGLYGLKDDNGKVVLDAQYQAISQLSYTPSKKVIIPMHAMDEVEVKKLHLYKIKKNNLWGVSTSGGHISHDCKYKNIEIDSSGDLIFINTDGSKKYAHPVLNAAKATRDTFVTIVGLPVTLVGTMMIPIEAVSKVGQKK